jgi:type VI protein secretion system component VasK
MVSIGELTGTWVVVMGNEGVGIWSLIFVPVLLLFFLPSIVAFRRRHKHRVPILLVNILVSVLYGVGWFIALVWCFWPASSRPSLEDLRTIKELKQLLDAGALTEEEYESQKHKLLSRSLK